jgi:hypothetical protein
MLEQINVIKNTIWTIKLKKDTWFKWT